MSLRPEVAGKALGPELWQKQATAVFWFDAHAILKRPTVILGSLWLGVIMGVLLTLMRWTAGPAILVQQLSAGGSDTVNVEAFGTAAGSRFLHAAERVLAFAPNGEDNVSAVARRVAMSVMERSGLGDPERVMGFDSREAIELFSLNHEERVGASIVFNTTSSYELGVNSSWVSWSRRDVRTELSSPCPIEELATATSSICSGLLSLQQLVAEAVARELSPSTEVETADVSVRTLPVDSLSDVEGDRTMGFTYGLLPLFLISSFLNSITDQLLHDRSGSREEDDANNAPTAYAMLKLAGMPHSAWWAAKVAQHAPFAALLAVSCSVAASIGGVFDATGSVAENSLGGPGGLFLVVFCSCVSMMPLYTAWITAPMFNNPFNPVARGIRTWVTLLVPVGLASVAYWAVYPSGFLPIEILFALFTPTALVQGIALVTSTGALQSDGALGIWGLLVCMLVGFVLNLSLAVHLDNVFDGTSACCLCCWCKSRARNPIGSGERDDRAVVVNHVSKTFTELSCMCRRKRHTAVNDVSLRFPAGQVTVLLGHNGAGKSTLIGCMLGMHTYNGSVSVFGQDSASMTVRQRQRTSIGYVAQGNVLHPRLSAKDHLALFAGVHGTDDAERVVSESLSRVGLDAAKDCNAPSEELSGGQRRKVALAIAMLGDPEFIVLDEPTAGVDAEGKIQIRSLIRDLKRAGRVILLTTHAMAEAEVLGDYTAILVNGRVQCEGPTLGLKKAYGTGYYLHVSKLDTADSSGSEEAKAAAEVSTDASTAAKHIVQEHVRGAVVVRESAAEIVFVLPMAAVATFPSLLSSLDASMFRGRFGIEMPSLEEIFIRITREAEEGERAARKRSASADGTLELECPALGCGATLKPSVGSVVIECSKCGATITHSDASTAAAADAGEPCATGTGLPTPAVASPSLVQPKRETLVEPSWSTQVLAYLWFIMKVERKHIRLLAILLVVYSAGASMSSLNESAQQNRAISSEPYGFRLSDSRDGEVGVAAAAPNVTDAAVKQLQAAWPSTTFKRFDGEDELVEWVSFSEEGGVFNASTNRSALLFGDRTSAVTLIAPFSQPRDRARVHSLLNVFLGMAHPALAHSMNTTVQPLRSGPQAVAYKSSALVSMYLTILSCVMAQTLGATPAGDREKGRRHQLISMGMRRSAYYAAFVLLHGGIALFFSAVWSALIFVLGMDFAAEAPPGAVMFVIFLVAFATIAVAYVIVVVVQRAEVFVRSMSFLIMFNMIPGMLLLSAPSFPMHFAWNILPGGAITQAFIVLDRAAGTAVYRNVTGCTTCGFPDITVGNVLSGDGMGPMVLLLVLELFIFATLLLVLERRDMNKELRAAEAGEPAAPASDDVEDATLPLVVSALEKSFPGPRDKKLCGARQPDKQVLRGLDLEVRAGSLLALLGPNGAGKSTAFNVISGKFKASVGDVKFNGRSVSTPEGLQERARRLYLAQQHTDATLYGAASVRDHIELYASIKGVQKTARSDVVERTLELFELGDRADARVSKLSGGQGRKGCAALALLGTIVDDSGKVVVLLDEISAGVDVSARRRMWSSFSKAANSFAGILCTHHLEEADTLSSHIAVIVDGRVVAAGSSQELKTAHGSELQLHLTCTAEACADTDRLERYVAEHVGGGATLVDASGNGHVTMEVPIDAAPLSDMFRALEDAKDSGIGIIDYSLAQPTLEQVFIKLVRQHSKDGGDAALARTLQDS